MNFWLIIAKKNQLKAGFHMIAGDRRRSQTIADRRSQIADDRKESCFHMIAGDRRRSQSRLFGKRKCQKSWHARCTGAKIAANNMADVEDEILLQSNLFLLFVLKRRHRQLQNRPKHGFRVPANFWFIWIFFRLSFDSCFSYVFNCDDQLKTHIFPAVNVISDEWMNELVWNYYSDATT